MTSNSRPDLSGLFSGTTAPSRTSSVADAIDPRLLTVTIPGPAEKPRAASGTGTDGDGGTAALGWLAPVALVERYFALLQLVLDVNRDVAVGCVSAIVSLPRRAGFRR